MGRDASLRRHKPNGTPHAGPCADQGVHRLVTPMFRLAGLFGFAFHWHRLTLHRPARTPSGHVCCRVLLVLQFREGISDILRLLDPAGEPVSRASRYLETIFYLCCMKNASPGHEVRGWIGQRCASKSVLASQGDVP